MNTAATGASPWVDGEFLTKHDVHGWSDMPMWIDNKGGGAGFGTMKNERAVAKGPGVPAVRRHRATRSRGWQALPPLAGEGAVRRVKPDKETDVSMQPGTRRRNAHRVEES